MSEILSIEQSVRVSHCSNKGKEHACIGTCKITPRGIELECKLCGRDDKPTIPKSYQRAALRAEAIFGAAHMDFTSLNDAAKVAVVKEMAKDYCPGCERLHFHTGFDDHIVCECGWTYTEYSGWRDSGYRNVSQQNPTILAGPVVGGEI